jgi:hypothetical protein
MSIHLILDSYTGQNVIAGTILSYHTDLGPVANIQNLDLSSIERNLAHYEVPAGTPDWKIALAQGAPVFYLHTEVVQEPVQLVGQHHHVEV